MARNKPRLQLALYARPKHPGTYHYALFISPKIAREGPTTKHHVKNTLQVVEGRAAQPWRYERMVIADVEHEARLLVRVTVAKVTTTHAEAEQILESVPIYQIDDADVDQAKAFTCRTWVQHALETLGEQNAVSGLGRWEDVESRSLLYLESKIKQRRWSGSWRGDPGVPLMDLLDGRREIIG